MRKVIVAATAVLVGVSCAQAADLGGRSMKDMPVYQAAGVNWAGLYFGGTAGFGVGDMTDKYNQEIGNATYLPPPFTRANFDVNGAIYGGHLGYNFQRGPLVFGLEGSFNGTNIGEEASTTSYGTSAYLTETTKRKLDWYGTGVGRLGYAQGNTLFYGFGGVAYGKVKSTFTETGTGISGAPYSKSATPVGWTAGIGLEHALSDNIIARVEYSHVDLGDKLNLTEMTTGLTDKVDTAFDAVKVGVSYKIWGDRYRDLDVLK